MRWSIRNQLLAPLLVLLVGVVAGISVWTTLSAAQRTRDQIEIRMRHAAQVIDERSFPLSRDVLKMTEGLSGADFILLRRFGSPTTTLDAELVTIDEDDPTRLRIGGNIVQLPAQVTDDPLELKLGPALRIAGQEYFCSGVRVRENRPIDEATLYFLYPVSLWRDALQEAILPPIVLGAIGVIASLILAVALAQRLGRRIQQLERRTRLIAAGDFSPMPLPRRNDELRDLVQSVNDMAIKLAEMQDAILKTERLRLLGQLGGGLAHQLRNGVTGARLAVQLHARECNGQVDSEDLDVALRQLALVEAHVKRFLDLGNADELNKEACSLPDQIDAAVSLLRPQCQHAGINLTWQRGDDISIEADTGQLDHLFLNVIGNAIEAAGPGGAVEIKVHASPGAQQAVVEILDSGPGPTPEVAEKLFDPFVTGKREGVGLGLAVARRVVEAHGGRIHWERADGRTCFRIRLPLTAAAAAPTPVKSERV